MDEEEQNTIEKVLEATLTSLPDEDLLDIGKRDGLPDEEEEEEDNS